MNGVRLNTEIFFQLNSNGPLRSNAEVVDAHEQIVPGNDGNNINYKNTKYLGYFSLSGLNIFASMVHLLLMVGVIILSCLLEKDIIPRKITQTINVWASDLNSTDILFPSTNKITNLISLSENCKPFIPATIPYDGTVNTIFPKVLLFGEIDNRISIGLFFLLSFAFQLYNSVDIIMLCMNPLFNQSSWLSDRFYTNISKGQVNKTHFAEYSLSATLMVLVMITQIGVTDLTVIVNTCVNTWACMIFGLLAEFILDAEEKSEYLQNQTFFGFHLSLITHMIGWIPLASVIFTIITPLATYSSCIVGKTVIPDFVFVFVIGEVAFFCVFGLVQFFSIRGVQKIRNRASSTQSVDKNDGGGGAGIKMNELIKNACATEAWYIFLSLFAKTFLALTIYIGINTQPG